MHTIMKRLVFTMLAVLALDAPGQSAEMMSLDGYLAQVHAGNREIRSIDLIVDAMGRKALEMDMVYSSLVNAGYNFTNDKSGGGFGSTLPSREMEVSSWNAGVTKKFHFGSTLNVGYVSTEARFDLLFPTTVLGPDPISSFTGYDLRPTIRLDQSLLRDFRSGLTQAGIDKTKAATRSGQYQQLYRRQQLLLRAESAYWALSFAREMVFSREASLQRAEELLRWNQKRVSLDLADKGDLYQAQAAFRLRQLNLRLAREDEAKACREFNQLRGKTSDVVGELVERLSEREKADTDETLAVKGERPDVIAARATYESSEYAARETYYRSLPELTASASYSLRGLGFSYSDAWQQVAGFEKPAYGIGLSLIVPLDYRTLTTVRKGYSLDHQSAKEALEKAELSVRSDVEQLLENWNNVRERLALAVEIRDIQNQRLANEQRRFERGRTTTFQLLTAENDLDDATINVSRFLYEKLLLRAQAKLYRSPSLP